jgi:hypothetical protein
MASAPIMASSKRMDTVSTLLIQRRWMPDIWNF